MDVSPNGHSAFPAECWQKLRSLMQELHARRQNSLPQLVLPASVPSPRKSDRPSLLVCTERAPPKGEASMPVAAVEEPRALTDQLCVNTIRTLAMDGVQKANSGHPGTPMALAPVAFTLYDRFMRHNPKHPGWANRDRFVLSAG